jgi:hypothetical protein
MKIRNLVWLALAMPACAHTAPPRVRPAPALDLRDLCGRAETGSFCTPAAPELPLVDTNLVSPHVSADAFAG